MHNNAINRNITAKMLGDNYIDLVPGFIYKVKHVELGNKEFVLLEGCGCFYDIDQFVFYEDGEEINIREVIRPVRIGMVEAVKKLINRV